MKSIADGLVKANIQWFSDLVTEATTRWVKAVDMLERSRKDDKAPRYTSEQWMVDMFSVWRQVLRFDPLGHVGGFPYAAFVRVSRFRGIETSNPVPALNPSSVELTALVRVGSGGDVFPEASVVPGTASVALKLNLTNIGKLPKQKRPKNGHYTGLLWEDSSVIARVDLVVDVP